MRAHTHANPYSFRDVIPLISPLTDFGSKTDTVDVEIGTGTGLFLRHYASLQPSRNVVGVEVRKKMADLLNERIKTDGLTNVKMVYGTAERLLATAITTPIIDNVFVFHPDPWFKKRHHNRRVIRPDFLPLLRSRMTPNGRLYLSTDVTDLWEAMKETLDSCGWTSVSDPLFWATIYTTHWKLYTQSEKRLQHFGVWRPN